MVDGGACDGYGSEKEKNYHPSALFKFRKGKVMACITVNKPVERSF